MAESAAIRWARQNCFSFSVSGRNINVSITALERLLFQRDELCRQLNDKCDELRELQKGDTNDER